MAADIETKEPIKVEAGTTVLFKRSLPDFPASVWTLTYHLRHATAAPINFSATADGDTHSIAVSMAVTADWVAGFYSMVGYVSDGSERHRVFDGRLEVTAYAGDANPQDRRSYARKMLDSIEQMLLGAIPRKEVSYTLNGRSFTLKTTEDLLRARDYFRAEVRTEERRGKPRLILGRFKNAR